MSAQTTLVVRHLGIPPVPPAPETGATSLHSPGITLSLVRGEIAKQQANAIVNTISQEGKLNQGKVSNSILREAGPELQTEMETSYPKPLQYGQVAVTTGCKLQCRHVLHVCLSRWAGPTSVQVRLPIVAVPPSPFPALGMGNLQYPEDIAAQTMVQAVGTFEQSHPTTPITEVRMVIHPNDHKIFQAFKQAKQQGSALPAVPVPVVPSSKRSSRAVPYLQSPCLWFLRASKAAGQCPTCSPRACGSFEQAKQQGSALPAVPVPVVPSSKRSSRAVPYLQSPCLWFLQASEAAGQCPTCSPRACGSFEQAKQQGSALPAVPVPVVPSSKRSSRAVPYLQSPCLWFLRASEAAGQCPTCSPRACGSFEQAKQQGSALPAVPVPVVPGDPPCYGVPASPLNRGSSLHGTDHAMGCLPVRSIAAHHYMEPMCPPMCSNKSVVPECSVQQQECCA
ncbi:hypothetical protein ACOMHN_049227 [Nucella lapillus]